jgi:ribose/xylose/arabinose/galactoside ABC-type transport system permease subunit
MSSSIEKAAVKQTLRSPFVSLLLDNFVWLLVIVILIVAAFTTPVFFRPSNLVNLLVHSVVLALLVLAESICLISGNFDLSIESILIFTAVFSAWLIVPSQAASGLNLNPAVGIPMMLVLGAGIGALNGFLIAYVKMNAFITTLAVSIIMIGSCVYISRGNTLGPFPDSYNFLGSGNLGGVPVPILVLILVYILFYIILNFTPFGRKLYAVGGNKNAAQASGINVKRIVLLSYLLSGLISALAGWVLAGRQGAAVSHMTKDNLMYAFAAAVIGGVSPFGGEGKIISILGGVILLMTVNKLLIISHVNPFLITGTSGVIIFLAMLILTLRKIKFMES